MLLLLSSSQSTQASHTRDKRIETFSDSFPTQKGDPPFFSVTVNIFCESYFHGRNFQNLLLFVTELIFMTKTHVSDKNEISFLLQLLLNYKISNMSHILHV